MEKDVNWSDTQKIIALLIVISFILIVVIWMFVPPKGDAGAIAVLNTLVGTLGAGFGVVLTFYFGNNKSSTDKDNTIKTIAMSDNTPNPLNAPSAYVPPSTPKV